MTFLMSTQQHDLHEEPWEQIQQHRWLAFLEAGEWLKDHKPATRPRKLSYKSSTEEMARQRWDHFVQAGEWLKDHEPPSPLFVESFSKSRFGGGAWNAPRESRHRRDVSSGLLGTQASAADCHFETDRDRSLQDIPMPMDFTYTSPRRTVRPAKKIPHLPAELHLQITKYLIQPDEVACGHCNLSTLHSLSLVSRLYNETVTPVLYNKLPLNLSAHPPSSPNTHCSRHAAVRTTTALTKRVPLLVRTLQGRTQLAKAVRSLELPQHTRTWLSCDLEAIHLPALLQSLPNLESLTGLETLLARQFFQGEHYCDRQHGELAMALRSRSSLKTWTWDEGYIGRDFHGRIFDHHPGMEQVGFTQFHDNWRSLEHLELHCVKGITAEVMEELLARLPSLRSITFTRFAWSNMLQLLRVLPSRITAVEVRKPVGGKPAAIERLATWIVCRHAEGQRLRRLALTGVYDGEGELFIKHVNMELGSWKLAIRSLVIDGMDFGALD